MIWLSLPPDFVLDFGWALRDEGIVYSLQINRGHLGLSDIVFFGSFASITDAVATLQNWLGRLAADEPTQQGDVDLQARLFAIARKLRCYFAPPSGDSIDEVFKSS